MTFDDLADLIDRYADVVASVGMRGNAAHFRKAAAALRADPESAELGGLYFSLTRRVRENYLDQIEFTFEHGDDPETNQIGRTLREGAREVAEGIRRTVLSPEAYGAFRRLEEEQASLSRLVQMSPVEVARWSGILEEHKRLLEPVRTWGLPRSEFAEPETPFAWLGTAVSLVGKVVFWLLALAFVWAILRALWPF